MSLVFPSRYNFFVHSYAAVVSRLDMVFGAKLCFFLCYLLSTHFSFVIEGVWLISMLLP